jgi:hypothetical protein
MIVSPLSVTDLIITFLPDDDNRSVQNAGFEPRQVIARDEFIASILFVKIARRKTQLNMKCKEKNSTGLLIQYCNVVCVTIDGV